MSLPVADRLAEAYVEIITAPPWEHRNAEATREASGSAWRRTRIAPVPRDVGHVGQW